ncbi:MAG: glutathione S-transferase family protein [Geminicoccaceae bacterium]
MYILYGGDFTRSVLVQWILEEGGLEYELRKIDILKAEHRTAEFLAINPAGLVPVMITPDGQALYETAALMVYLADRHGLTDLAPPLTDPAQGLFLSTIFYLASDIQSEMKRFHYPHRYSPRREDNTNIQDLARAFILSRLAVINDRLAQSGPHTLGTRFSLVDSYLSYWVAWLGRNEVCNRLPLITKLYDLIRARPRIGSYIEETERMAAAYASMMKKNPEGIIS